MRQGPVPGERGGLLMQALSRVMNTMGLLLSSS